jgi:SAM-dependent methyltransferase
VVYVHGYSARETERLQDQSSILTELIHHGTRYAQGEKILEAGCGVGAQTRLLARFSPSAQITAVDISQASLSVAQAQIEKDGLTNVTFLQQDICRLAFADESFDHLFICFVLEHLDDPLAALFELKRVLKPGGSMTIIEGDHGSCFWHPATDDAREVWQALIRAQSDLGHDGLIGRKLYPLLQAANLKVMGISPREIYADSSDPVLLNGVVNKIIVPMVNSAKEQVLKHDIVSADTWDKGISDLSRVGQISIGTFFYSWFKALAVK